MSADRLLNEYKELENRARELKGRLRCNHCDGNCVTPEIWEAKQALIEVTMRMDEINEALGRERRLAYH